VDIQPENKKRMKIADYLAGHRVESGMAFSMAKNEDCGK
jgi:hypothetical protein